MATIGIREIGTFAYKAGFRDVSLATAIAVAMAESGGNTTKRGKYGERGLWQINTRPNANPQYASWNLEDPATNARAAYEIWSKNGWQPWSTFTSGAYEKYQVDAVSAQSDVEIAGGVGGHAGFKGNPPGETSAPGVPGSEALQGVKAVVEALNRIGAWISSPGNILRIVEVVVGGGLLLVAIAAISKPVTEPIVKTAAEVTPAGRAAGAWFGGRAS
jgi:Lysozyme like domain